MSFLLLMMSMALIFSGFVYREPETKRRIILPWPIIIGFILFLIALNI